MAGAWFVSPEMVVHIHLADADAYLVVERKRVYFSFHEYCGPSFYLDIHHKALFEPDEDWIGWANFTNWHNKYEKNKNK